MQIVIDIPEFALEAIQRYGLTECKPMLVENISNAIKAGTPLPAGHGDLVDRDSIEVLRIGNIKREYDKGFDAGVICMVNKILDAPTIIEGSDSECRE